MASSVLNVFSSFERDYLKKFLKEPENLSIEEADFEVYYPDLDEDFWGED